jgi:hypothetical protein
LGVVKEPSEPSTHDTLRLKKIFGFQDISDIGILDKGYRTVIAYNPGRTEVCIDHQRDNMEL